MSVSKKIELIANVAIVVVASLLATVLIKNNLLPKPPDPIANRSDGGNQSLKESRIKVGEILSIEDIHFAGADQTLVLAISSSCQFCSASAPFYKKLVESKKETRLVAVFPQSTQEGQDYLKRLGVAVDEARHLDFNTIGVEGTPTLLLVDSAGVIKSSWVGKLSSRQESEVLNAVRPVEAN